MPTEFPDKLPRDATVRFLRAMADDELMLGHRDAEWTGHAPILEEDIAFSNIAQDELGHAQVWYSLIEQVTGRSPDSMAFGEDWSSFTCCRFVTFPREDFAYSIVRQYLFDQAEQIRLSTLTRSSYEPLRDPARKILSEETYHLHHSQGLVERLGDATEESHRRMQEAVDLAFPQALGMFEPLEQEADLIRAGVFPGNVDLQRQWLNAVVPVLAGASLHVPVERTGNKFRILCAPEFGGRAQSHLPHLQHLVADLQQVYRSVQGASW